MQRDERDALQALLVDRAPIGEPIIVGPGERDRVIRLAHSRQHQPARRIDDLEIDAFAVVVGEVLRRVLGLFFDLAVLVPVEAVARVNKAALPVLLGETLAVHALVIDGVAVGIDDQHAVLHRGGPPGYILVDPDDTTGGARPATRAWSGQRSPFADQLSIRPRHHHRRCTRTLSRVRTSAVSNFRPTQPTLALPPTAHRVRADGSGSAP